MPSPSGDPTTRPPSASDVDDVLAPYDPAAARALARARTSTFEARARAPRLSRWDDAGAVTGCSYTEAEHGPEPAPAWVITSDLATDEELGILKTGKEADVFLVERRCGDAVNLLAAKRYRGEDDRTFRRDEGYTEGRKVRRSREARAMANKTAVGRRMLASRWAEAEFALLGRLWEAGVAVPYPVQLLGSELLLELIGDERGAAPRLAQHRPADRAELLDLFEQALALMRAIASLGLAHADLSPFNLLVHHGRLVAIDLPQAIDVAVNPRGPELLRRDCRNVCDWFARRGLAVDAEVVYGELLALVWS